MPLPDSTLAVLVRATAEVITGRHVAIVESRRSAAAIILFVLTAKVHIIGHWGRVHTVVVHVSSEVVVHHARWFLRHRGEHGGAVHAAHAAKAT